MHIAVIRHSIRNRGGDWIVLNYLYDLCNKGHNVTYWTNEISTVYTIHPAITIKRIPLPGVLGTILFTLSGKFRADVLLVDLVVMAYFASFRNVRNTVYLAQDYDLAYHQSKLLNLFIEFCYKQVFQNLKIPVISESDGLTERLNKFNPAKLLTIPNGVDLRIFYRNVSSKFHSQRSKKHVILLFARSDYRKGLDIAQKAIEELQRIHSDLDWEIWCIGENFPPMGNITIRNFGFVKVPEELRDIMSVVDIYLVPSRSEGLSLLLLQALACQCAVVSSTASTVISHEINGLLSPIEDWRGLAINLDRLMRDQTLSEDLKTKARILAEEHGWEKNYRQFEQTLLSMKE